MKSEDNYAKLFSEIRAKCCVIILIQFGAEKLMILIFESKF